MPGPAAPSLRDGEAHVWRADLDAAPPLEVQRLAATLSAEERRAAGQFVFAPDRRRFTVARGVLRAILSRYLGCESARIELARTPHGKPRLATPGATLLFNVSHAAELALYALAPGREIGVDVERIQPAVTVEMLGSHVLSATETAHLRAFPPEVRDRAVFAAWTRKEAYLKARGVGLPGLEIGDEAGPGWTLHEVDLGPGWAAALAVEGPITTVRYWIWEPGVVSGR